MICPEWNTKYFVGSPQRQSYAISHSNRPTLGVVDTTEGRRQDIDGLGSTDIVYELKNSNSHRHQGIDANNFQVKKNRIQHYTLNRKETKYYSLLVKILFENNLLNRNRNRSGVIKFLSSLKINETLFRASLKFYGEQVWFD